ncbi:MAG: ABC transporter permease [Massilia sp.]
MLHHLLKLVWKRKTGNLMLSLEILLAFVIVFAIAAFGARNYQLYQLPTGVRHQDVWWIHAQPADTREDIDAAVYDGLRRALKAMPEVEEVAFVSFAPFTNARRTQSFDREGKGGEFFSDIVEASDDFYALSNLRLLEGRWFSKADDGAAGTPVVINRLGAQTWFPGQSAVGKVISGGGQGDRASRYLVTGVVEDYRSDGEFKVPVTLTFTRFNPDAGPAAHGMKNILVRLKPGTPRIFEARLDAQLKRWRSGWSYSVQPLADARAHMISNQLLPLGIVSVIAAFLLLMVGFGLFGVLWQNTTRRIPEIGLRRALGASAAAIYRQIIAEQLLLSTAAMALALLMLVQLPLTKAFGASLNWPVFLSAAGVSMAVIYLISLLCSLYPGWRASRLSPTQALHYE